MPTRASSSGPSILPACLIFAALLWAGYWLLLFPSWKTFLHSDNVVPYIMTIDPWLKQDFFYWGAERFGAIYSTLWKVVGRYLFGSQAAPFYTCFPAFFFVGTAFWLAAIRDWARSAVFLVIMMPFMIERVDQFLYPGHVYGTLYCFIGAISYLLVEAEQPTRRQAITLGVLCALTYWQHLLAGLIMVFLVALKYWTGRQAWGRPAWRVSRPFWATWVGCLVPIEIARGWATLWDHPVYGRFEKWPQFLENFQDFLHKGLAFELGPLFGQSLAVILVLATPLAVVAALRQRRDYLSLFVASSFLIALACIVFFNFHHHYTENSRHERYFSFVVPMVIFGLTQLPVAAPSLINRVFTVVALSVLLSLTVQRVFIDKSESIFDPPALAHKGHVYEEGLSIAEGLERAGCNGVLDSYWRAYRLAGITNGELPASAIDHVRNPVLFDRISHSDHLCIAGQYYEERVKPLTQTRSCAKVEYNYWLCRPKL